MKQQSSSLFLTLVEESSVNLYKWPSVNHADKLSEFTGITIGDLHGNALKLLYMLIKHGIVSDISEEDYQQFVKLYELDPYAVSSKDIAHFHDLLAKMTCSSRFIIRLIGDELADRGSNDYFMLKILERLHQQKVPFEIIMSNHGAEFMAAYESKERFEQVIIPENSCLNSMLNLQILLDIKLVQREAINTIIEDIYKPNLRLMSYALSPDKQSIILFSHAAIGLETIRALAKHFLVEYQDDTAQQLATTLNELNIYFHENVIASGKIHIMGASFDHPFYKIIWNREYEGLERPERYKGYQIFYAHGHDDKDPTTGNVFNLDTILGKSPKYNKIGKYMVLMIFEPVNHDLKKALPPIYEKINFNKLLKQEFKKLQQKADTLWEKGEDDAAQLINQLYIALLKLYFQLVRKEIKLQAFTSGCQSAFASVNQELKSECGLKQYAGNFALILAGVGVFYLMAGLLNRKKHGQFLFFKSDKTSLFLDSTQARIKEIIQAHDETKLTRNDLALGEDGVSNNP